MPLIRERRKVPGHFHRVPTGNFNLPGSRATRHGALVHRGQQDNDPIGFIRWQVAIHIGKRPAAESEDDRLFHQEGTILLQDDGLVELLRAICFGRSGWLR